MQYCGSRMIYSYGSVTSSGSNPKTRKKEKNINSEHTTAAARLLLRKNVTCVIYEK
jgi:hypothetical protein